MEGRSTEWNGIEVGGATKPCDWPTRACTEAIATSIASGAAVSPYPSLAVHQPSSAQAQAT